MEEQWLHKGREDTKVFLEDTQVVRKVSNVADNARAITTVEGVYQQFLRMRGSDEADPPLLPPSHVIMDFAALMDDSSSSSGTPKQKKGKKKEKEKLRAQIRNSLQLVFVCLPNNTFSEVKSRPTKALQSSKACKCHGGSLLQCVQQKTLSIPQKHAKDAILYSIAPSLPAACAYYNKLERIWIMAIGIIHRGLGIDEPSVAMLCLPTLPFCGTQRGLHNHAWLNSRRKDVITYAAVATMTTKALTAELARIQDERTRTEIMIVFRDGAPDNALKKIHSKELVGGRCGIYEVRTTLAWNPKLQFIVVSKDKVLALCSLKMTQHIAKKHPFEAEEAVKRKGEGSKHKTGKGGAKMSTKDKWKPKEVGSSKIKTCECAVTFVSVLMYYVHTLSTGGEAIALCIRARRFATKTNFSFSLVDEPVAQCIIRWRHISRRAAHTEIEMIISAKPSMKEAEQERDSVDWFGCLYRT